MMIIYIINYYKRKGEIWDRNEMVIFNPNDRKQINLIINNLISDIDNVLRFKIKNYFLNYYLIVSEKVGKQNAGANWAEYVEYGTTDDIIIELQIIGSEMCGNRKGGFGVNTYQVIDERNWERAMHCMVFRESVEPAFCVTFEADITNFRRKVKAQNLSFTLAFVYAVCKCADEIEAFRYRFLDGKVVLFGHIDTAFTYLNQDTGLFKVVNVPLRGSIQEYVETAGRIAREQKEYFTGPLGNDVFQCSPMPWVTYTHISHTNSGKKDNATPLFDWGKYYEKDGKIVMPVSVQAHHSFVDGIHVGQFADRLQKYLESF